MNRMAQQFRYCIILWLWSLLVVIPVITFGETVEVISTRRPIPHEVRVTPTDPATDLPANPPQSAADWNPQQPPRFEHYPVEQISTGALAPVVITPERNSFSNRIQGIEETEPNFAGHYRLTLWECGADCVTGAVVDVQNGQSYPLPGTICCWPDRDAGNSQPLEFQPDSNLLMIQGRRDQREDDKGRHYYRFENGRFVYLGSVQPE